MDKKEHLGGFPDFIRQQAVKKINSGCAACRAEGAAMMQMAADMEGQTNDEHSCSTTPPTGE